MVDLISKRVVIWYPCCPNEPYPELHFRVVFRRHPQFYIYHMILPCLFLSVLSLVVFYLPPDCGEKVTFSITNLLALVVFQQIFAENMPPSSDDSPVIGIMILEYGFVWWSGNRKHIPEKSLTCGRLIIIGHVSTEKRFTRIISCREYRDPFV